MGLVLIVVVGGWLYVLLAPAREVLRGDDRGSVVPGHAYLAFVLWVVPLGGATAFFAASSMVWSPMFRTVALSLLPVAALFLILHAVVSRFGRPAFLVPHPYRPPRGQPVIGRRAFVRRGGAPSLPPT
jgi:hypothetical protein